MSFLKVGKAVHDEVERANEAQAAKFGPGRFWLAQGGEGRATFLDGALEDGLLQTVSYYEHGIPRVGKKGFDNYVCTQEKEVCPICEEGGKGGIPSLVFAFTILDHREWKDKNDKIHQMEKRLFVCKRETFARLQKKAEKLGGLVGVTFDISRIGGEKTAAVGTDFDFVSKNTMAEIHSATEIPLADLAPFNYEETIKYHTAEELRKLGFGTGPALGHADAKATPSEEKKPAGASSSVFGKTKTFDASKEL